MSEADQEIAGWKTMADGRRLPLLRSEADALMAAIEANQARIEALMPDEQSAISTLFDAHRRLQQLGWRDAVYCPKDGSIFEVIEAGSTGIFRCRYEGQWPAGSWWIDEDGGTPSRPVLFRLLPEAQAAHDMKMAEAARRFLVEQEGEEQG